MSNNSKNNLIIDIFPHLFNFHLCSPPMAGSAAVSGWSYAAICSMCRTLWENQGSTCQVGAADELHVEAPARRHQPVLHELNSLRASPHSRAPCC